MEIFGGGYAKRDGELKARSHGICWAKSLKDFHGILVLYLRQEYMAQ